MKPTSILLSVAALADCINAVAAPQPAVDNIVRDTAADHSQRDTSSTEDLWKRKGGGGGGGKGGGGGGGSSGSGTGTGGRGGGGGGGAAARPPPAYGGGTSYSGGAKAPYKSGGKSPSGIVPLALGGAVIGGAAAYAFWPGYGLWAHPIYYYPYHNPYRYYNRSSAQNETRNVGCGCDQTQDCSCDEDANITSVLNELVGNGSYTGLNASVISVGLVNGTQTLLLNGTLEAIEDDDDTGAPTGATKPNAGAGLRTMLQHAGWWPAVAAVGAAVFLG